MNSKLLDIYVNKFTKGQIDFRGIKLKITYDDSNRYPITVEIQNPDDLPYTKSTIENAFQRSFEYFWKLTGLDSPPTSKYVEFINLKDKNIPRSFINKISKASKKIKTHNIIVKNLLDCTIDVEVIGFKVNAFDDEIELGVNLILRKIYDNIKNKELELESIKDIFDIIYEEYSIPEFNFELCEPMAYAIYTEPTFFDNNYSMINIDIRLYSPTGKRL